MNTTYSIEGMENVQRILKEYPEKGFRKAVIAGFKKAAQPVRKAMIANLPPSLSGLKKIIKVKPGRGKSMTLSVGAFGRQALYRNSRGQSWDPGQLIYWFNYGTLSNREASHTFKTPRKKGTADRKGGLVAGLFMEKAWAESQGETQKTFEETADKEAVKWLETQANKG